MNDPAELALVYKALASGLSNCVEWKDTRTSRRIRQDPELKLVSPNVIKEELLAHVARGGEIRQIPETRPEYSHYRFYYKAVLQLGGFAKGLFVEFVLSNNDEDCPCVNLVNAHVQG